MFGLFRSVTLLLAAIAVASSSLFAAATENHPLSIVEADIYVTKKKVIMRLKCFAEDLELLQGVEPYEDGKYDNTELKEGTKDHAKYLLEKIIILDAAGEKMVGKVTEIAEFDIPEGGIEAGNLMNFTMGYVFEYSLDTPPDFITIEQQMVAEGALLPSELKVRVKQAGSDVPFPVKIIKPSFPETYPFDWENMPPADKAATEDWESWFDQQREKNLGIESYGSVYSFFYITRSEVRQEVLIPVASLSTFIDIESKDGRFLEIEEQDALKDKIKALFSQSNPVTIGNGDEDVETEAVVPKFDRIDFYGLDVRDFVMQSERRKISMANGRVGLIMSYASEGAPKDVSLTWDMFNSVVRSVDAVVVTLDKVGRTQFSKFIDNNTFTWSNEEETVEVPIRPVPADFDLPILERFPWLTVLLFVAAIFAFAIGRMSNSSSKGYMIAGGLSAAALMVMPFVMTDIYAPWSRRMSVAEEKANDIFEVLHANLFRAFDFSDEGKIYDGLEKSVDGKLLRELYLQLNNSLRIESQGNAVANISAVNFLDGELKSSKNYFSTVEPGFVYRCKWNLVGTIEHWGHLHERTNVYDATFDVQAIDNEWKITSMKLEDVPKGTVKTSLRKLTSPQ